LTPLAVIKAKTPSLMHVGFASPQQALPHADCESHLIVATVLVDPVPVLVEPVPVLPLVLADPVPVLVEPVPVPDKK
jgi:hypothetical protein